MTAVNIAIDASRSHAYVMTDSGYYRERIRRFLGQTAKVVTLPHAESAITGRGRIWQLDRFSKRLRFCSSFDEATEVLGVFLQRSIVVKMYNWLTRAGLPLPTILPMEFFLVGWSEKENGFKAVLISNIGSTPYQIVSRDIFVAPGLPQADMASLRIPTDLQQMAPNTWADFLLGIVHSQRDLMRTRPKAELVSGSVVLTTLSRQGIAQRVVHRWNDKVGARLN